MGRVTSWRPFSGSLVSGGAANTKNPVRTGSIGSPHRPVAESPKPPAPPIQNNKAGKFHNLVEQRIVGQNPVNRPLKSQVTPSPKNIAEVTQNLVVADRLHKAGVFPTTPSLGIVARDALVSAGINGLVSSPLSIATYAGSSWSSEAIKGHFSSQTPLLPPLHQPAPSQGSPQTQGTAPVAGVPPGADSTAARLGLAELRIEVVANNIMAIREGTNAQALKMSENSSSTTSERLSTLESLYGTAETELKKIADENDMVFRPYSDTAAGGVGDDKSRLDTLEKKFEAMNKFIGKLILLKTTELPQQSSETQSA
jgi:hypothetical protein